MNNTGSLNAVIGADINGYQKAMGEVANLTRQAFNDAQKASQVGAKNMLLTMQHMMKGIVQSTNADTQRIISQMGTVFNKADSVVRQGMARIADKIPEPIAQAMQRADYHIRRGWGNIQATTQKAMSSVSSAIDTGFSKSFEMASNGFYRLAHSVQDISPSLANTFNNLSRQMAYASENGTQAFMSGMRGLVSSVGSVLNSVADQFNPLVRVAGNTANQMVESFSRGFNNMNRKASDVLNKVSGYFAGGEKGANSFKSSVMQLASAFSLAGLASKAINTMTSALDGAISRYDTLENANKVFENMGFGAEETAKMMDSLTDSLDGIPTAADDAIQNIMRISMANNDIGKAGQLFEHLNYAILATGKGSEEVNSTIEMFSRSLQRGTMNGHEWEAMMRNMGPTMNNMADLMGISINDLQEGLSKGTISFEEFETALHELAVNGNGDFASLEQQARDMTDGITTAMSNFKNRVAEGIRAGIIKPLDEALEQRGLPKIADMINTASSGIRDSLISLGDGMQGFVDNMMKLSSFDIVAMLALPKAIGLIGTFGSKLGMLAPLANKLSGHIMSGFSSVSGKLGELSKGISGFGGLMTKVSSVGVSALGGMVSAITSLAGVALSAIGPTAILGLIVVGLGIINKSFGEEISKMLIMVTEKAPEVINNLVTGIQNKLPELLTLGTQLITDLTAVIVSTLPLIINAGMDILNSLITGISNQFPSLINSALQIITVLTTAVLEALPQLVLMGFQIILAFVQGLNENIDTIINSAQTILNGFINSFIENLPQIIETGINIILSLIQGLNEMLPELLIIGFQSLTTLVQGIMDNVPLLLDGAVMIVQNLVNFIVENLPLLLSLGVQLIFTIIDGIFQNLPQLVVAGTQIIFTLIGAFVQMLPEILSMGITLVTELISGIAQNLPMIIATGIQLVFEFIGGLFQMLPEIWNMGWNMIVELGKGLMEAIPNILSSAWEGIKSGFDSMWNWVTGKNKEGSDSTKTDFSELSDSATTSTSQMATNVSQYAGNATDSITNASNLANSAGSKDYSHLATNVSSSMSGMTSTVATETGTQLSTIQSNLSGAGTSSANEFKSMSSTANTELSNMTSTIEMETSAQENAIKQGTTASNKQAEQSYKEMAKTAQTSMSDISKNTDETFKKIQNTINQSMNTIMGNIRTKLNTTKSVWNSSMTQIFQRTHTEMTKTRNITNVMMNNVARIMRSTSTQAYSAGLNTGYGFQRGLSNTRGSIMGTARGIANSVSSTIKRALSIKSPSRKLMGLGSDAGEGLDLGLLGWVDEIKKTSIELARAMLLDDYEMETTLTSSASIESSGVSSRLDNLSDEVKNTERAEPVIEVHSHWDGDEVYYYVKRKDARKDGSSKYFKN